MRRSYSVAHVALLAPWVAAILAARVAIRDNSFLWHVRAGTLQIDRSAVLSNDPFSFTKAGEPWRTQSWLAELGYGFFDVRGGLTFVGPMVATLSILTFLLVGLAVYRATRSVATTAVIGIGSAWLGVAYLGPRPVLFSYVLLAFVVLIDLDPRLRWSLPLVFWIWASVHASFVIGLGYLLLSALRRRRVRSVWPGLVASLAAVSVTAHGLWIWSVVIDFFRNGGALDYITEWAPPDFTNPRYLPFVVGVVLLLVGAAKRRLSTSDMWVVAPLVVLGMTSSRSVFPAWIALSPLLARSLPQWLVGETGSRVQRLANLALALGVAVIPFIPSTAGGLDQARFPLEAARELEPGPLFHDDVVGGYLIYAFWPELEVFIDDRAELYGADFYRSFTDARFGRPEWREVFAASGISQALLRPSDPLSEVLRLEGWRVVYQDEHFVVLKN